jgi:hypothetical protein
MDFNWTIGFGDVLTSVTILVSVAALVVSWWKDRWTRETEQADKVRTSAARALTKLDRWQTLHMSLYRELQPIFIEISEALQKDFDLIKARDDLWKRVSKLRAQIASKVLEEEISLSYVELLSHFPTARTQFRDVFHQLSLLEEQYSQQFLEDSQGKVLSLQETQDTYTSAMLGNALRESASTVSGDFQDKSDAVIELVRQFLFDVITRSNRDILRESRNV